MKFTEKKLEQTIIELLGKGYGKEIDLFDADYLAKIEKIKLPNTKIKILQQLLAGQSQVKIILSIF